MLCCFDRSRSRPSSPNLNTKINCIRSSKAEVSLTVTFHKIKNSWHSRDLLVRHRRRLQMHGHGTVGPVPWRPLPVLFSQILTQNCLHARRADGHPRRIHADPEFPSPWHETWQFPHGCQFKTRLSLHDRFWVVKAVSWPQNRWAYSLPRWQILDWNCSLCQCQHSYRSRIGPTWRLRIYRIHPFVLLKRFTAMVGSRW